MPNAPLEILFEDNHLLVVNKAAGLATQGAAKGKPSVVAAAKQYLKREYHKPGNVFVGVVSRLDLPTSGVLVLARTSKAAARLSKQFAGKEVEKVYWALVERPPLPPAGRLTHWLWKDDERRQMIVVPPNSRGSQKAVLTYQTLQSGRRQTLVEVRLETGRKHQIRVQLAAIHCPILGDAKYGGTWLFPGEGIALHALRLSLDHPTTKERLTFEAPPPPSWKAV